MARNRAERGSILLLLVSSVTFPAGAVFGLTMAQQGQAGPTRSEVERTRAVALAEGGLHEVAVRIRANAWPAGTNLDWSADDLDNDGDGLVDEEDESLTASAVLWGTDGVDNDGDGDVDETDEGIARVTSTAGVGASRVTLTRWVEPLGSHGPTGSPRVTGGGNGGCQVVAKAGS
jgi:hypothetical protein